MAGLSSVPGLNEVRDGESLNDVLGLSGGLRDEADTGNIILSRYSKDEETNQVIDLAAVDIGKLEPSDILYAPFAPQYFDVKQRALKAQDTNRAFAVQISGEVQFPGTYYVRPGERLSDLIARSVAIRKRPRSMALFLPARRFGFRSAPVRANWRACQAGSGRQLSH